MPHADAASLPAEIQTKTQLWDHIFTQVENLLHGQRTWVSNLANVSSVIHNSLLAFSSHFGDGERMVNWCGFYIDSSLFPTPIHAKSATAKTSNRLLLGPFCGKPACQFINYGQGRARGVCADAYNRRHTLVVPDVEKYPGHIACDGHTKSEIVVPLLLPADGSPAGFEDENAVAVGVLDLDCLALDGFDDDDRAGLERIVQLVVAACDW